MTVKNKIFPIQTATACKLKWNWSTLYLNIGHTMSCHRTGTSVLTKENFKDFHNTDVKIKDRQAMLEGRWPDTSCAYCKNIEESGGTSDRMRHLSIPELVPAELYDNPTQTHVEPVILEVFFSNACNFGCLYCDPYLSSTIDNENRKFGDFIKAGVKLTTVEGQYRNLVQTFWEWFPEGFQKIQRFNILGGEPFQQKDFDKLLSMIEQYPNPGCQLNVVTNLSLSKNKLETYIQQFKKLLQKRSIARVDLTISIDCWGAEQEYVRYGLDLQNWLENFEYLLEQGWLTLNINQTISALTIKTMPALLEKLNEWRSKHKIGHWFSAVSPGPSYLKPEILGPEFVEDSKKILALMPQNTAEDLQAYSYMQGILNYVTTSPINQIEIENLIIFLNEKDRRRNTNWQTTFPWLKKYVV